MSGFAIRYPFFIIVLCLMVAIVGTVTLVRMPVDLFPTINIPVVVVATFYSGMPPEQIETDITGRFERFFTLGSNIDHIESRSLPGVSIIKVYFQSNTNPDSDVTTISNLAMAQLRRVGLDGQPGAGGGSLVLQSQSGVSAVITVSAVRPWRAIQTPSANTGLMSPPTIIFRWCRQATRAGKLRCR